ncbi:MULTISPECIES: alpha/beta hydrolase [Micromonospora]|uniref:Uncharacterized protein n=1 Tax=Micromonospora maris TaxID=1003110 RepID=A0A9X0LBK3_9ACTN|nr:MULTISPECIES: alpha/beta hydrolase [Micromonospora]AEB44607.1 hypothetical protein VAB18032_17525 [Micromonospora maris AB-18-032]KUJ44110.1 hypothetical protein ADL17_12780 [Micromonospora maris]
MSAFGTPVKHAAWRDKPSWAVIATDDKAFDQATLQHMAKRIGAEITNVAASHAVFMTQPAVVADVTTARGSAVRGSGYGCRWPDGAGRRPTDSGAAGKERV